MKYGNNFLPWEKGFNVRYLKKLFSGMEKQAMRYSLLVFIWLLCVYCGSEETQGCPDALCANYTTQAEAQAAFEDDPECMNELDADNDGIACEHLSTSGGNGCPTTSNCGCSGKNKTECASACCQWIVGTGCKCK